MKVIATLQVPDIGKGRGHILAISTDRTLLLAFKWQVLKALEEELAQADDEVEALILRADLERKRRVLTALIPDGTGDGKAQG